MKNQKRIFIGITIIIIAIISIASVRYFYMKNKSTSSDLVITDSKEVIDPEIKNDVVITGFKTATTSNGFSFSIPFSWTVKPGQDNNSPYHRNFLALSNDDGKKIGEVTCPRGVDLEGPMETAIFNSRSRIFEDAKGKSYEIKYEEWENYDTYVNSGKKGMAEQVK